MTVGVNSGIYPTPCSTSSGTYLGPAQHCNASAGYDLRNETLGENPKHCSRSRDCFRVLAEMAMATLPRGDMALEKQC